MDYVSSLFKHIKFHKLSRVANVLKSDEFVVEFMITPEMLLRIEFNVLLYLAIANGWATVTNRKLEEALMKSYNRKHRPVKKDSTTMQIQIYLLIGHIEKVDENEQTMLLHGLLWTSWIDEYLKWDPSKYNNTRRITIETWKIWQPALSLYN
ncbi:hypothetical protein LOAG_13191 [Loa loa]|uniref:Neurotransmitter-gated ion-channel ligand-binding domain-containing protein n=1 Tax=Loa loa TaxID=7209 RepID=A0A1S0TKY2_LOALO|nr:hypothetical protein LOAG_13191 [Loa loa]EFO15320.1 hypothetical protein LOAG_13191 [Loa loa]